MHTARTTSELGTGLIEAIYIIRPFDTLIIRNWGELKCPYFLKSFNKQLNYPNKPLSEFFLSLSKFSTQRNILSGIEVISFYSPSYIASILIPTKLMLTKWWVTYTMKLNNWKSNCSDYSVHTSLEPRSRGKKCPGQTANAGGFQWPLERWEDVSQLFWMGDFGDSPQKLTFFQFFGPLICIF